MDLDRLDLAQGKWLRREGRENPLLLLEEEAERRLVRGAVAPGSGGLPDPDEETLVGHMDVSELLASHEVALQVVDAVLDLALVVGRSWPGGADDEAVVLGHAPVGLAQDRIVHQSL
jgi:hypothetical protein